jgi:hypothetical protein
VALSALGQCCRSVMQRATISLQGGSKRGKETMSHNHEREITCGFPRRSVQPSIGNLKKICGF